MIILGFDSASVVTGWAVFQDGPSGPVPTAWGRILLPAKKPLGFRLVLFRDAITELFDTHKPDEVCYEHTHVKFFAAARALYMVNGIIEMVTAEKLDREARPIRVATIRKTIGSSSKAGTRDQVSRLFSIHVTQEKFDISDALAVAYTGFELLGKADESKQAKAKAKPARPKKSKGEQVAPGGNEGPEEGVTPSV